MCQTFEFSQAHHCLSGFQPFAGTFFYCLWGNLWGNSKKTDNKHRELYEEALSTIEENNSNIEKISTLNQQNEEKLKGLEKENEALKARITQLESKPETVKDEGNAPTKSK